MINSFLNPVLSPSGQRRAFFSVAVPLALTKFFQETLYVMSYFMEKSFGVAAAQIYDVAKYQPLGVALGYIVTAFFVDKFGIKKMLAASMMLFAFLVLGFSQNTNFDLLIYYRLAMGMCIGCVYNCSFGALPIIFNNEQLPSKTSLIYAFAFTSAMLAPQIMTFSESALSWRTLLVIASFICAISAGAAYMFFPHKPGHLTFSHYKSQIKQLTCNKVFLLMAIVSTLCMGGFYGFIAIFMQNLINLNISSSTAKFIITDMQFIGRILLFAVTLFGGARLTQKSIPSVLKTALIVMTLCSAGLFLLLQGSSSLFGNDGLLAQLVILAQSGQHVFGALLTAISGAWLFWLYTAFIGLAQPANKSKALSIGKHASGSAQAILGFCLSVGEFLFASLAAAAWPYGAYAFLTIVFICGAFVAGSIHIRKHLD